MVFSFAVAAMDCCRTDLLNSSAFFFCTSACFCFASSSAVSRVMQNDREEQGPLGCATERVGSGEGWAAGTRGAREALDGRAPNTTGRGRPKHLC